MNDRKTLLSKQDERCVQDHGFSLDEVRRQWALLTEEPQGVMLDRPSTIDDGIERLSESDYSTLLATHQATARQGRWRKFVPASGAASRMFALKPSEEQQRFCESLHCFPFGEHVQAQLRQRGFDYAGMIAAGAYEEVIQAIVSPNGLGYGQTPKGLLEFHSYGDATRTAFEEHLLEAVACFGASDGGLRAHFTVGAEHQDEFAAQLQRFSTESGGVSCDVSFSVQHPATDTISLDQEGEIVRSVNGDPHFRPGGHGALIENLNSLRGDLIFVKNIDNIAHQRCCEASHDWIQILGGYLVRLQDAIHQHVRSLKASSAGAIDAAFDFIQLTFPSTGLARGENPESMRRLLLSRLDRPLRVCGMVKNEGEPGGGPFWVREADGSQSLQVVEAAEIMKGDLSQEAIFSQATHFNPVFMALSVRNEQAEPFDLRNFVNQDRVIRATKQIAGKSATVLERPGLWNGGMAGWNSVFVEVPIEVFTPVKSVLDLLRPQHHPVHDSETSHVQ